MGKVDQVIQYGMSIGYVGKSGKLTNRKLVGGEIVPSEVAQMSRTYFYSSLCGILS